MVEIDTKELIDIVPRRAAAVFRNASLLLAAIYVLGFIYLKTYLAVFGFQVDLAGISVLDLLLCNRYFVSQHLFVAAGLLQAFLMTREGWQKVKSRPYLSLLALFSPFVILFPSLAMSAWSEQGVPLGVHIDAAGIPLAFLVGWASGWLIYWLAHNVLKYKESFHMMTWLIALAASLFLCAYRYRLYAKAAALDRSARGDFQSIEQIETDGSPIAGPCRVIHIDSHALLLHCNADHRIVLRDKMRSYRVQQ